MTRILKIDYTLSNYLDQLKKNSKFTMQFLRCVLHIQQFQIRMEHTLSRTAVVIIVRSSHILNQTPVNVKVWWRIR